MPKENIETIPSRIDDEGMLYYWQRTEQEYKVRLYHAVMRGAISPELANEIIGLDLFTTEGETNE